MKFFYTVIIVLLVSIHCLSQTFKLKVTVPVTTNVCYIGGDFNGWKPEPLTLLSNSQSSKVFTIDISKEKFTNAFKILSGPEWKYEQVEGDWAAGDVKEDVGITISAFKAIYIPSANAQQQPVSAHHTVYIEPAKGSYSFVNNDFAFFQTNSEVFFGVIITSLPANGTLTYNNSAVSPTNVEEATVFTDRTKFAYVADANRKASSFSFKVKDSKNEVSKIAYIISIKYNLPVSKLVRTTDKNYIDYKGLPFLLYGIQMRIDDYLGSSPYGNATKWANIDQYFEKASLAGFRDVAIPVPWNYIETSENTFNFSIIEAYLTHANKNNMRMQFLWFGSNVCGWSNLPSYINNNTTDYPKISSVSGAGVVFANPKLIEKEKRAVAALMNYIAQNDLNKRVVLMQVENEPDHIGPTQSLWGGGQKDGGYQMLDSLGQVIHRSEADMVTRVNLAGYTNSTVAAADFASIKGINIVGRDFYSDGLSNFLNGSGYFIYPWNLNHTPENGAQYKNLINLTLAAFDKGAGYINYELRTTGWRATQYDLGLYRKTSNNDWVERDGTQTVAYSLSNTDFRTEVKMSEVKDFNEMIYKADKKIAKSSDSKNAAFNLSDVQGAVTEIKTFGSYSITYTSQVGGEAFAMEDDKGDIILMSLKDNSSFAFQELPANFHASIGYFDDKNGWHQTTYRTISDNKVILNAKEVALLSTTIYSDETTGIPAVNKKYPICIFPNPNQGKFNINVASLDFTPRLLEVFNLDSRLVYNQILSGQENLFDINSLKRGLYLLRLSGTNTGKEYCDKLLIN